MRLHPGIRVILTTSATAMSLSSCAVKDGRLDFTWWQDAAAPVLQDDVIIESGGNGYYHSAPAPVQIPVASIPTEQPVTPPQPPKTPARPAEQVVAQQQPATPPPPAAKPTRPAAAQTIPGVHVVQPGDTLTAIARRYGTTVSTLVSTNGMASANVPLRVNQKLRLPGQAAPAAPAAAPRPATPAPKPATPTPAAPTRPAGETTYKVQAGDTLYRISRQYGVNPRQLMQANGLTPETANTIRVGTLLRIPASN